MALLFLGQSSAAYADVRVLFQEGTPKDRFEIRNTGICSLGPMTVTLDLAESSGGLFFDISAEGPGVEVFEPFELVQGAALVRESPEVEDGGRSIELRLIGLSPRQEVAFTIDVDDTLARSALGRPQVTGSEIKGARVAVDFDGRSPGAPKALAHFTSDAVAVLPIANCDP